MSYANNVNLTAEYKWKNNKIRNQAEEEVIIGSQAMADNCKDLLLYLNSLVGFKSIWSMCSYLSKSLGINISTLRHQIYDNPKNPPDNLTDAIRGVIFRIEKGDYPEDLLGHLEKDAYIQANVFKNQFEEILKYDKHSSKRGLCKSLGKKTGLHPERIRSYLYGKRHMVPFDLYKACKDFLGNHLEQKHDKVNIDSRGHTSARDFINVFKQIENSSRFGSKVSICGELSKMTGTSTGTIRGYLYHSPQKVPSILYKSAIKLLDKITLHENPALEKGLTARSLEENSNAIEYLKQNIYDIYSNHAGQFTKTQEIEAFNRLQWKKIHINDLIFNFRFVQNYIIKLISLMVQGKRKVSSMLQGKKDGEENYLLEDIKNQYTQIMEVDTLLKSKLAELQHMTGSPQRKAQLEEEIREISYEVAGCIRQFDWRTEVIERCYRLIANIYRHIIAKEQKAAEIQDKAVLQKLRVIERHALMSIDEFKNNSEEVSSWLRMYHEEKYHIFRANIGLVKWIARENLSDSYALEDLMQEGSIGLLEAIERFDNVMGYRFSTYARWWIQRYIKTYLDQQAYITTIPEYLISDRNRMIKHLAKVEVDNIESSDIKEIAKNTNMSEKKVSELIQVFQFPVSLSTPVDENSDTQLIDMIDCKTTKSPESTTELNLLKEKFLELFGNLSSQEERVLLLRFGINDGLNRTLREIGELMGLTRERVRQIEKKALEKMRTLLLEHDMEGYALV